MLRATSLSHLLGEASSPGPLVSPLPPWSPGPVVIPGLVGFQRSRQGSSGSTGRLSPWSIHGGQHLAIEGAAAHICTRQGRCHTHQHLERPTETLQKPC